MPSSNITGLANLTAPQPTMLLYTALSPFGATDDRKITANALLATVTQNISDVSLQFDDGLGTATVSAAGKGKLRYNDTTKTFQASVDGAAYADLGGGGGMAIGGTVTGGTTGSVLFVAAGPVLAQDNANFFWDNTNDRLGVATASPSSRIDLNSPGNSTSSIAATMRAGNDGGGINSTQIAFGYDQTATFRHRIISSHDSNSQPGNHIEFLLWLQGTDTSTTLGSLRVLDLNGAGNVGIGVQTYGTSAAKVLAITNGTAPASSPADIQQIYSADAAAGDAQLFVRNEAGSKTRLTGTMARNSSQFDKVDATLANVTGLSFNVEASTTYSFEAILFADANITGGSKYAIAGTATATAIIYEITLLDDATNVFTIADRQTALGGSSGQAGTTAGMARITGTITVANAGTLTVQFAQNAANGTSSVLVGSYFRLWQG